MIGSFHLDGFASRLQIGTATVTLLGDDLAIVTVRTDSGRDVPVITLPPGEAIALAQEINLRSTAAWRRSNLIANQERNRSGNQN